jgi:protease-4
MLSIAALPLLAGISAPAHAEEASVERPVLPSMSIAADDGALSIWRNPANLAFDPDPSYGLIYAQPLSTSPAGGAPTHVAGAGSIGPLGGGLSYQGGGNLPGWWTLSSALGIRAGRSFGMGAHVGWQMPDGPGNNFVSWDVGMGWRPLHWMGISGVAYNIGAPAPQTGITERLGAGMALRPLGNRLVLAGEYMVHTDPNAAVRGYLEGTARIEPVKGLAIRGFGNQLGTVGVGLEFGLGKATVGTHGRFATSANTAPVAMGAITSSDGHNNLLSGGRLVPEFTLDQTFPYQPFRTLFSPEGESYLHLLNRLEQAASDRAVKTMLVHLDWSSFSFAQIEEILTGMDHARANGKKIVAYMGEDAGNGAYMIASGADLVLMHPAQQLGLVGLSAELMYFRGTLDLVGVEPQFARRSEYKSAAESYTNTGASAAAREQMDALLDDISMRLVQRVAIGRGRDIPEIREIIDGGPYTATEAIELGLVDDTAFPDEIAKKIRDHTGRNAFLDDEWRLSNHQSGWRAAREIAVIYVDGVITTGPSRGPGFFGGGRTAGSETIVRQLNRARQESSVKAVLLRVDSPGGSAYASDEIWRAVEEFQLSGKPVVVSMGGVAASGGYYVSSGADAIYASSSTITGSIGVIGGKFSLAGLYDKIGISYELYNRGRKAAMFSMSKPFDDTEYAAFDKLIGDIYNQFTNKVAVGRGMTQDDVYDVAGGRVWSGTDARDRRLVDEIGGFQEAVTRAKVEAGIQPSAKVDLIQFKERQGAADSLARESVQLIRSALFPRFSMRNSRAMAPLGLIDQWRNLEREHVWALMPYNLDVR